MMSKAPVPLRVFSDEQHSLSQFEIVAGPIGDRGVERRMRDADGVSRCDHPTDM
jgi:hypothetical protein